MQPQLVAEAAHLRQAAAWRHQRRERAHRVAAAVLAHRRELVGDRPDIGRSPVGERLHGARGVLGVLRILRPGGQPDHVNRVLDRQAGHVDDFEARRSIAEQPQGAHDVPAREHEPVTAQRDTVDEFVEDPAQAGKAFERAQLEELVEQEGDRIAAAGARPGEVLHRLVKRGARAALSRIASRDRRTRGNRMKEPFRRRRDSFDVNRLRRAPARAIAELLEQGRTAAPASTDEHRDPRRRRIERPDDAARQCRTRR